MNMKWLFNLKVMPILVIIAALSFGVRFGDFMSVLSTVTNPAQAQEQEQIQADTSDVPPPSVGELSLAQGSDEEPRTAPVKADSTSEEQAIDWRDSGDSDLEFSAVRMELFEDLSARRKDLNARERELSVREALLKAAEQEIDQKYNELISLRSEIQDLLVQQTEEEKMRVQSLVKIYEGMKPKDAARIFNTLDRDVLLQVISQMSERKSAPIIASMSPDRARTVTMMLIEQKTLPDMTKNLLSQ